MKLLKCISRTLLCVVLCFSLIEKYVYFFFILHVKNMDVNKYYFFLPYVKHVKQESLRKEC